MKKKTTKTGIILMILSALITSVGQASWKYSDGENFIFLVMGLGLYVIGAVLMILALRYGELSILHPLLSFGYVFSVFIGVFVLNETLSITHTIGIIIIAVGAVLVGGGKSD
ncbi:EamA family transporter [Paenibacillus sp. FSL E2-8871]|uniref:EamA family transporter n=1 Tax=Paenibacillus sp. FSL E2-8871 TaxID=2975326 RepID=UPI0030F6D68B